MKQKIDPSWEPSKDRFLLNPHQVQPLWLVITSPHFRTDERNFDTNSYHKLNEESIKQIVQLRESGLTYPEISHRMGISKERLRHYYDNYTGKYIDNVKNVC